MDPYQLVTPPATQPPLEPLPPRSRSRRWIWVTAIVVLLGLGGGGYFAYSRGYVTIPFLSPKVDELFDQMVDAIGTIEQAQYTITGSIQTQPRDSKATPILENANAATNSVPDSLEPFVGLGSASSPFSFLPTDMKLSGSLLVYAESAETLKDASGRLALTGSYETPSTTLRADLELRKVGDTFYGIVRKFPLDALVDISSIRDAWVKLTPEDLDDVGVIDTESIESIKVKEGLERLKLPLQAALEQQLIRGRRLGQETVAGVVTQHYRLEEDLDQLVPFLNAWKSAEVARDSASSTPAMIDELIASAQKQEIRDVIQRIADNSRIELWVERNRPIVRQFRWTFTFVPPADETKLKDVQYEISFTSLLEHVNERVSVDTPSPTISFLEAQSKLSGQSVEELTLQRQIDRVYSARSALTAYQRQEGSYPDSLEQLTTTLQRTATECASSSSGSLSSARAKARDAKRKSDVSQLRTGLVLYYDDNGGYPATLAPLSPAYLSTLPTDPTANESYDYEHCTSPNEGFVLTATLETTTDVFSVNDVGTTSSTKLTCADVTSATGSPVKKIDCVSAKRYANLVTTDLLTGKPFGYAKDGDDYKLTYQVTFTDDTSSFTKDRYAEGVNTATSKDVSIEKESSSDLRLDEVVQPSTPATTDTDLDGLKDSEETTYGTSTTKVDTDADGLTDYQEVKLYRTNPLQSDTDGDSYSDGTEVQNGYDPNGAGRLVSVGAWSACVDLDELKTCTAYCTSVGKTCTNNGATSRGYPNRGKEVWTSASLCTSGTTGAGQYDCDDATASSGARWKCFCTSPTL